MTIKKIDHIAIVVPDIDAALMFWRDALGLELSHVEDMPAQESLIAFLPTGGSEIELVKPTIAFIHPKSTGGVLVELYE
jgi:methylmalonyl-CoA/ethylmalonyl-CoA epimerase